MPEEAPAVQNWRLLIVACVLGLVVMVVYNLHINKVRRGAQKEEIVAYRYERNMDAGDTVEDADLKQVKIRKDLADSIGRLLYETEKETLAVDGKINRDVSKNDFVMAGHFGNAGNTGPVDNLREDEVAITIQVDTKRVPGSVLRIGNYVSILGMLPDGDSYKTFRIIERLKVVAIGGQTERRASGRRIGNAEGGVRSYSSITVVVKRVEDNDVSLQWSNLETHLRGLAIIELCPSKHAPRRGVAGKINDKLKSFTTKAANVSIGGYDSDT